MRIKGHPERPTLAFACACLLAIGAVLGVLFAPLLLGGLPGAAGANEGAGAAPSGPPAGGPPVAPAPAASAGPTPVLQVAFTDEHWRALSAARERALAAGMIVQREEDVVPCAVTFGEDRATGRARLKGDWLDHVDTDKWSLRFELDEPVGGMRRFSVQHPKTRGFVMEWLVTRAARRENVLAPRSDFVEVRINGEDRGLYYLEEHFSKELLEAQGRRDGPIVRFDESAMWATWLQHGFHLTGRLAPELARATSFYDARAEAFGEKRLMRDTALNARLVRALELARQLQLRAAGDLAVLPLRQLRALEARALEEVFAVDRLGRFLALYTLFGAVHGLAWHQFRFYHDPVLDRLEPIVFDTGANFGTPVEELAMTTPDARWFRSSDLAMAHAFAELGRMTEAEWVDGLTAEVGPRLAAVMPTIHELIGIPGVENLPSPEALLRQRATALHAIARPVSAASFAAEVVGVRTGGGEDRRVVEVEAWATTDVSTQVSGFRFSNGRVVAAVDAFHGVAGAADAQPVPWRDGAVLLPRDGRRVRFRFPVDRRLAGLADIAAIKRAIRSQVDPGAGSNLDLEVLYRPVAERDDRRELLALRRAPLPDLATTGRPTPPTLEQALARHPFLRFDLATRSVVVPAGRHEVDGDLVTPAGLTLRVEAGAELLLPPGGVVVCAAIVAEGAADAPVRFGPRAPVDGFAGLQVVGGGGTSVMRFVEVASTTAIARGGWQSSGGVTFYRAPVQCSDCTFSDARCEDALNVVGARVRLERCTFDGGPHDLFDGDFVDGELLGCTFRNSGEDAFDVSGSTMTVSGCTFDAIGDKALSVGEGSNVTARGCRVLSASIAACAKDRSKLVVQGLEVARVENFVVAVYEKKPEFGAAEAIVDGLTWKGGGAAPHLVQEGSRAVVGGVEVPAQPVDVERLYKEGVLGK